MSVRSEISRAIADARNRAASSGALAIGQETDLPPIVLERPANPDHGDWASNVAMQLAPVARDRADPDRGDPARALRPTGLGGRGSVAAPGFLNFRLDPAWVAAQVGPIRDAGAAYGRGTAAQPQRINVEFVSANPTGPLHVGNARGAFVGDLLCRVLEAAGHDVTREYYFNDFGAQVEQLGASVRAIRQGSDVPEDGYHGEYVAELAARAPGRGRARRRGAEPDEAGWIVGRWASERIRAGSRPASTHLGVHFDVWKTESSLHDDGLGRARRRAAPRGRIHLRGRTARCGSARRPSATTRTASSSARTAQPTYFAADIGYVIEKFSRGFDELIYIWGADHHGTVARLLNAAEALGHRPARRSTCCSSPGCASCATARRCRMSKRSGEFVTLDELLAEVGVDAARWFFGSRAVTTRHRLRHRARASKQSSENPVYYVQYAHARIASILRNASRASGAAPDASMAAELLTHPSEQALVRGPARACPTSSREAAERRETHEHPRYCDRAGQGVPRRSTATAACSIRRPASRSGARLALVDATRQVAGQRARPAGDLRARLDVGASRYEPAAPVARSRTPAADRGHQHLGIATRVTDRREAEAGDDEL